MSDETSPTAEPLTDADLDRAAGGFTATDDLWKVQRIDGQPLVEVAGKMPTRVWGDPHVSEADGTRWD